jgi:glucokinase-like ROK family protein
MKQRATANQGLIRKLNTSLVLDCLRTSAPLSRADISAKIGLNRSTVSSVINELHQKKLVREMGSQPAGRGRPGISLELNPNGGCAVGVEIGVDFISTVLTDFTAQPLLRQRIASDPQDSQSTIIKRAESLIQEALNIGEKKGLPHLGIGLGVPGLVDIREGKLVFAPNLSWHDVPFREKWTQRFEIPVFVENEANAAALGEYYFGVAHNVQNVLHLSAGVGLGSGIIINGRLFRGSGGYAGEAGHMTIDPDGELCGCGKRGCWETVVGPRAIARRVRKALENGEKSQIPALVEDDLSRVNVEVVVQAAQAGDRAAKTALKEVGVQLGVGIANLVNLLNPELVVLGGALSLASPFLLPAVEETVHQHALEKPLEEVKVAVSAHGPDACVMGAIALVLDDILREPML